MMKLLKLELEFLPIMKRNKPRTYKSLKHSKRPRLHGTILKRTYTLVLIYIVYTKKLLYLSFSSWIQIWVTIPLKHGNFTKKDCVLRLLMVIPSFIIVVSPFFLIFFLASIMSLMPCGSSRLPSFLLYLPLL